MSKIKSLSKLAKICARLKKGGKSVGLVTGCFDVLHFGHIQLFHFAKKHVDFLIIGVDNDKSVRISKGPDRPIFPLKERLQLLAELKAVDYVFPIKRVSDFKTDKADVMHEEIIKKLKPSKIITNVLADKYWQKKKKRSKKFNIVFIPERRKKISSSSEIMKIIEAEI